MTSATCLTGIRIWDGEELSDADALRFEGERITAVGDARELVAGATEIDCQGATAIPGLIDAHVHMELNPDDRAPPTRSDAGIYPHMRERARSMVEAGITTARDLGGGAWYELRLRDEIASGAIPGPRLICAGQPITCVGGHCHFWGGEAADLAAAEVVLQRQLTHGVDLIKVMASGGVMTRGSRPLAPQFDVETLSGIVEMAHQHGRQVAAHCHGTEAIEFAARARVNSIEHCSWVGPEGWASDYQDTVAALIVEHGAHVSPTVNKGWQRYLDNPTGKILPRLRHAYEHMLAKGVRFIASTDAGIPGVYHKDLPKALPVFAGISRMTNEQTLASATSTSADALGLSGTTGRLKPGLAADVLLVDGNPLEDLTALATPIGVWSRGRSVTPASGVCASP